MREGGGVREGAREGLGEGGRGGGCIFVAKAGWEDGKKLTKINKDVRCDCGMSVCEGGERLKRST